MNIYIYIYRGFLQMWLIAETDMSHTQTFVTILLCKWNYLNNKIHYSCAEIWKDVKPTPKRRTQ